MKKILMLFCFSIMGISLFGCTTDPELKRISELSLAEALEEADYESVEYMNLDLKLTSDTVMTLGPAKNSAKISADIKIRQSTEGVYVKIAFKLEGDMFEGMGEEVVIPSAINLEVWIDEEFTYLSFDKNTAQALGFGDKAGKVKLPTEDSGDFIPEIPGMEEIPGMDGLELDIRDVLDGITGMIGTEAEPKVSISGSSVVYKFEIPTDTIFALLEDALSSLGDISEIGMLFDPESMTFERSEFEIGVNREGLLSLIRVNLDMKMDLSSTLAGSNATSKNSFSIGISYNDMYKAPKASDFLDLEAFIESLTPIA